MNSPTQSLTQRVKDLEERQHLLIQELEKKTLALQEIKREYLLLLNETTPQKKDEAIVSTNFKLEQSYREYLGSIDPQNQNNMTRGLKFLLDLHMMEDED